MKEMREGNKQLLLIWQTEASNNELTDKISSRSDENFKGPEL